MVDPKEVTSAEHLKALVDQINEGRGRTIALLEQEKAFLGETRAFTESQRELLNINLNLEQQRLQILQQKTAKSAEALYNLNSQITAMELLVREGKKLGPAQQSGRNRSVWRWRTSALKNNNNRLPPTSLAPNRTSLKRLWA